MSAEQASRLSPGRGFAVGCGFLFLAGGGMTVTALAGMESMHDVGVAASADFKGNEEAAQAAYHERTLDNYGALGGLLVAGGSTAAAAVSMRGLDFMRVNGQWYSGATAAATSQAHTA